MKNFIVFITNNAQTEIVEAAFSVIAASESAAEELAMLSYIDSYCATENASISNTILICETDKNALQFVFEITLGFTE